MEGRDDRQAEVPGSLRRHQSQGGVEAAVHVDHVDPLAPEQRAEVATERGPGRYPGKRPGAVDGPAGSEAPHERRVARLVQVDAARRRTHVGRDHDGGVTLLPQLEGQVMNVLGDAAQVGIVVLGDERDPHSPSLRRMG